MITSRHIGTILIFASLAIGYIGIYKNEYKQKTKLAFNSFVDDNQLDQKIYNPCSSKFYLSLCVLNINLNQEIESKFTYFVSGLSKERIFNFKTHLEYDGDSIPYAQIKESSNLCYDK